MKSILDKAYTFSMLRNRLAVQEITVMQVVKQCLEHIQTHKSLNAFIHTYDQEILNHAHIINQKIIDQKAGPLAGMIIGLKDMIAYQDHPLQAGSKILSHYISPFNATLTQRLLNSDALIIGHQNCDEFGMGSSSENPNFGTVRNPLDNTKVAGGSSGGSAAATKANMCHVSIGTDTGGSVRQPAAFCGLVGLKPTYGRISRYGIIAYASSFDTAGILAHTAEDCASVLDVIAGPDPLDHTTVHPKPISYLDTLHQTQKYKIAYIEETLTNKGLQPEIKQQTLKTIKALQQEGHQVDGVHFSFLDYILPTYYILVNAEASTNLARFDGIRYGYRSSSAKTLEEVYLKTRTEGFGQEVKKRIMLGTFVLSSSYYGTFYEKARKVRIMIKKFMNKMLSSYDFILLPTTTTTAFKPNHFNQNPLEMYWSDIYTVLASIAGLPAISIPNGVDQDHMPIGLQIIGSAFQEDRLLAFCHYIEKQIQ